MVKFVIKEYYNICNRQFNSLTLNEGYIYANINGADVCQVCPIGLPGLHSMQIKELLCHLGATTQTIPICYSSSNTCEYNTTYMVNRNMKRWRKFEKTSTIYWLVAKCKLTKVVLKIHLKRFFPALFIKTIITPFVPC